MKWIVQFKKKILQIFKRLNQLEPTSLPTMIQSKTSWTSRAYRINFKLGFLSDRPLRSPDTHRCHLQMNVQHALHITKGHEKKIQLYAGSGTQLHQVSWSKHGILGKIIQSSCGIHHIRNIATLILFFWGDD